MGDELPRPLGQDDRPECIDSVGSPQFALANSGPKQTFVISRYDRIEFGQRRLRPFRPISRKSPASSEVKLTLSGWTRLWIGGCILWWTGGGIWLWEVMPRGASDVIILCESEPLCAEWDGYGQTWWVAFWVVVAVPIAVSAAIVGWLCFKKSSAEST